MNKIKIKLKPVSDGWEVKKWHINRWVHWLPSVANAICGKGSMTPYKTKEAALAAAKKAKEHEDSRTEEIYEI